MSLLEDLLAAARYRLRTLSAIEPRGRPERPSFGEAVRGKDRLKIVAEYKRASPARATAASDRGLLEQVRLYERSGAVAVSVLTEPTRFGGSLDHLREAAAALRVPVLMKDFVVDPAQVRVAAALGARAVLLIVRCLSPEELEELAAACHHYGLSALVECHDRTELERALSLPHPEGMVIGVNNRNLDTLAIDRTLAPRLLREIPADRLTIAESGYERPEQLRALEGLADAVLVGSALMTARNPASLLQELAR